MILFEKRILNNGLTVLVHEDKTTPMAAFNLLYNVGARDEDSERTGFAHLFEHLMFGGSANIPDYDSPLQRCGGESNAFTSNDITNYYDILPAANLETAFWLESDRMLSLSFDQKVLNVQKGVVSEEFKERYLNQPYGNAWLKLRPLAYKTHPYQWPTIGKSLTHIENADMQDVKDFFYRFYRPNNAVLCIAGNIKADEVFKLAEKWFGPIPMGKINTRSLAREKEQTKPRHINIEEDVPYSSIYKAYHMCERNHPDFYATDMITDVLSLGASSRFEQNLVKGKELFLSIDAYITGSLDPGLIVIEGKLKPDTGFSEAEAAIEEEVHSIKSDVKEYELEKIKNKLETQETFNVTSAINKAMELSIYELLGDAGRINTEIEKYRAINPSNVETFAKKILKPANCSTIHYLSKSLK
ncbi:MAG TPA: insulinase family protein [Bacteroidetes bacterium]|nr:insulinase family protein [Bacteroidota bacterium]